MLNGLRRSTPERLAARGRVDALIRALGLRESDSATTKTGELVDLGVARRASAASFLAAAEGHVVEEALRRALADPAANVRVAALRSLVSRRATIGTADVAMILVWPEDAARQTGAAALEELSSADSSMAAHLVRSYLAVEVRPSATLPSSRVQSFLTQCSSDDRKDLVEDAVKRLTCEGHAIRAAQVIEAAPAVSLQGLVAALQNPAARLHAIEMLGRLRDSSASRTLVSAMEDPDPAVTAAVIRALAQIKDPRTIESILRRTTDDSFEVREAAMNALDSFGTAGMIWGVASAARGALSEAADLSDGAGVVEVHPPRPTPELQMGE